MGRQPLAIAVAIATAQVPIFARLLRGLDDGRNPQRLRLGLVAAGLRRRTITMSHVLPNSLGSQPRRHAHVDAGRLTIDAAALLNGLGEADPAVAEWGRMLVKAQDRLQSAPWLTFFPGLCIAVTALGFTLLGEVREALDPKSRR